MRRLLTSCVPLALAAALTVVMITAQGAAGARHTQRQSKKANGSPIIEDFTFECNNTDTSGLQSMHKGVIKACIGLIDAGNGYPAKYNKYGFPIRVTLSLPAGATFSGRIRTIHPWYNSYPKSTKPNKADKHWRWVKIKKVINGEARTVRVPRWTYRHLLPYSFVIWNFTIRLPGNPAVACIKAVAVAPGVRHAPKQVVRGTFYDSSMGAPPPTKLCNGAAA